MIDNGKQFNTKEADTLQTTEFFKIPNIFWDIRIALFFFLKAELFFQLCKTKIPKKPRVFQNSKIPKLFINLPKNFWNFGKLEVFLEFCRIPKKPKVFLEFDPKTSKNQRFFWNFITNSKKTHGF